MGAIEWSLLVALSLVWGGSFFFGEVALRSMPPLTVALCRVGFAALALMALCLALRMPLSRRPGLWASFLVMGAINNFIPFTLILWGQTHIASGLASILNATTPLFGVVLAHILTADERLTLLRLCGVATGLAGVAVMIGGDALSGFSGNVAAQLAVLAAAFSYAVAGIYGRRFAGEPPLMTACGQVTMSSLLLVPVVLIWDRPWTLPAPGPLFWASVAGLSLVSTALAYVLYFQILKRAGATNLLLVTFLIPVSAILLGTTILGEILAPRHIGGMALIALGLTFIDGRLFAALRTATRN